MRNVRFSGLLLVLIMVITSSVDASHSVFLKWNERLNPSKVEGRWNTEAPELDACLENFEIEVLKPLVGFEMSSDPIGLQRIFRLEFNSIADKSPLLSALRMLPGTIYAVEKPVRSVATFKGDGSSRGIDNVPGDPFYSEQYFHPLISSPAAWDVVQGDPNIVIAVVDNGTDWEHPDLAGNIWTNPGDNSANGIDDDGNGFIDDVRGWDFEDEDNDPGPETPSGELYPDFHGTHTAGLVAALMNNGRGVVGTAPSCKLMPVRTGLGGYIYWGIEGILYAAHNGADIISLSWGGAGSNPLEEDVINDARVQGSLIIAAAGNSGDTNEHYPAAYDGVMAVANTNANDVLALSSNHGSWVSLCAPGEAILSLVPTPNNGHGYGHASGTSMSTPIVAGVAALVKSYHPTWNADQIYAQILYTTDDVSGKNPLYDGMMGTGRVNAYRAVAETAPGLQIVDLSFNETDGDFDGKLEPGESAELLLSLENNGSNTSDVTVTLSSSSSAISVTQNFWTVAAINSGEVVNNSSNPFSIYVQSWAPTNTEVQMIFNIESEAFYTASLSAPLWIGPSFANHDTGNVVFTITDFGVFGYYNIMRNESVGSGFRVPPQGTNALYHGSLIAGISEDKVSDGIFGGDYPLFRFDFEPVENGDVDVFPGSQADQEGLAVYQDTRPPAEEQVGLKVTQRSYAWSDSPNDDFVILSFSLMNVSGSTMSDLYVGLYMDWDVIYLYQNEADWDEVRALGYIFNQQPLAPNPRYYGTSLLSHDPASYRVIDRIDSNISYPPTEAQKYQFMSAGFVQTASVNPGDQATLLAAGPFSLSVEDSVVVAFAVLGGQDLDDLQDNTDAALVMWDAILPTEGGEKPPQELSFHIDDVFPKPSNGSIRVNFTIPGPGEVKFDLIDVMGRTIPGQHRYYSEAGSYRLSISRWIGASGIYFLRGNSAYGNSITKVLWLK